MRSAHQQVVAKLEWLEELRATRGHALSAIECRPFERVGVRAPEVGHSQLVLPCPLTVGLGGVGCSGGGGGGALRRRLGLGVEEEAQCVAQLGRTLLSGDQRGGPAAGRCVSRRLGSGGSGAVARERGLERRGGCDIVKARRRRRQLPLQLGEGLRAVCAVDAEHEDGGERALGDAGPGGGLRLGA